VIPERDRHRSHKGNKSKKKETKMTHIKYLVICLALLTSSTLLAAPFTVTLPHNQWRMISLPATPPASANTVEAILDDDMAAGGVYGQNWVVYAYDTSANGYGSTLSLADTMETGKGYWVIQNFKKGGVRLDMPANSTETPAAESIPLAASKDGSVQWNLAGNPLATPLALGDIRLTTTAPSCSDGNCGLDKAKDNDLVHNKVWIYDGSGYIEKDTNAQVDAWGGFWLAALAGSKNYSLSGSTDITGKKLTDYGVKCNGTNESSKIQAALDDYENWTNKTLVFPKNKNCRAYGLQWGYKISGAGGNTRGAIRGTVSEPYVIVGNGSTIKVPDGTSIGNQTAKSWVLWIINASHIEIKNLALDGNRDNRGRHTRDFITDKGQTEQSINQRYYNSNLIISNSQHVSLNALSSKYSIEDGIYIGWVNPKIYNGVGDYPININLTNCDVTHAFRNNLTISNCVDCEVSGGEYSYATGVLPEAGIDLECDTKRGAYEDLLKVSSACIKDITIKGTTMERNAGASVASAYHGKPENIIIENNTFEDGSIRENLCDHHGSAISGGGISGSSSIRNNIFKNFSSSAAYDGRTKDACRSLIDFGASGAGYGGVIVGNNTFENIKNFKNDSKYIIYIHSFNGGKYKIINNNFKNIDFHLTDGDWYYDGDRNTSEASVFTGNKQQ
jgi:hypothetical protein